MDPNATLETIRYFAGKGNRKAAAPSISDLRHWLNGGGFAPDFEPGEREELGL